MVVALILFLVLPLDLRTTVVSTELGIYSDIIEIRPGLAQADFFEMKSSADDFSPISISGVGL
jgi:hypothetical protein